MRGRKLLSEREKGNQVRKRRVRVRRGMKTMVTKPPTVPTYHTHLEERLRQRTIKLSRNS
jgi:hypothetical protein